MASSSSSATLQEKYEVFLSFRGEDTRENFTSHLYAALCRKQIRTFIDEDGLQRGEYISEGLFRAIEESKITVIIFSQNYASSTWCLEELVKILKCEKPVIPVFYKVTPSDLRKQRGIIGDAFKEHAKRFLQEPEKVTSWRAALTEASKLNGWDSSSPANKPDSKLVDGIVGDIWKKLTKHRAPANDSQDLVGTEEHFENIMYLLSDSQFVGIWGMGGIGKTTIAKLVYKKISAQFDGCYFIENVREELARKGPHLRRQLLSEILEEKIGAFHIENNNTEGRVQSKKVLIVLDDVNDFQQVEALIGGLKFNSETKVIITTRDRQVLSQLKGRTIYQVKELNKKQALQVFSNYAFKQNPQTENLVQLSAIIVDYVKGHPLALKVLGSFLCGKSEEEWKGALHKLKTLLNRNISEILKISFDGLDVVQKDIFLDIACFFKGWDFEHLKKILDSCYHSVTYDLGILIDKSLITRTNRNKIEMHDLLQEIGWDIEYTKLPENRSRLWNQEDAFQVLKNINGLEAIHGVFLELLETTYANLSLDAFSKMPNLKFLNFYVPNYKRGVNISSVDNKLKKLNYLSNELRYLHWYGCPLKELPSTFSSENLVELVLPYSKLVKLWKERKHPSKLVFIDLHDSEWLTEIPDLSDAVDLEHLNLRNCKRLASFHLSNRYISKLHFLGLEKFLGVKSLPPTICKLKSLRALNLSGCSILKISEDLCFMPLLKVLDLSGNNFEGLPENLKKLSCLEELYVNDCIGITRFPDLPPYLQKLEAMNCKQLQTLPMLLRSQGADASEMEIASSCFSPNFTKATEFSFINCFKLIENGSSIVAEAQLRFCQIATSLRYNQAFYGTAEIRFLLPGSEIPDWISYRSSKSWLTIKLSDLHRCNKDFIGFILSAVKTKRSYDMSCLRITLYCLFHGHPCNRQTVLQHVPVSSYESSVKSDHVLLMFYPYFRDWIVGVHTMLSHFVSTSLVA